ncbi:malto-oligosyltrehalose synthase [Phyllobacterium zundukense]|nr:malto-oligosyltrehalose synthase [Phyllobacterium zundukense]ATU93165.1 malto-oligosyltrehalose synthase [Phyllobacterium zundukense]
MYIPNSAYRIQLRNGTTFKQAASAISYLKELGIDAVSVSSPFQSLQIGDGILTATDPTELDFELGSESGFAHLNSELASAGMHLIVDLNPNQMSASYENAWWFDVLEWGPSARHANHFDVDWTRAITLPVLERPINEEIQADKFQLTFDREKTSLGVSYAGRFFPLAPSSYREALKGINNKIAVTLIETASRATSTTTADFHTDLLKAFDHANITDRLEMASGLNDIAKDAGRMIGLMSLQNWTLVQSKGASEPINYRHSADSKLTVGLRVEDPAVFMDFHKMPLSLLEKTQIKGFRVNEIDELADPAEYTRRLRSHAGEDIFVVTDKILLGEETYNDDWHVNGTAGYEFISTVADLFVDHAGLSRLQRMYEYELEPRSEFPSEFPGDYRHAKASILHATFTDELERLVQLLAELGPPYAEELLLRRAIAELIAELPVYRTYSKDGALPPFDVDMLQSIAAQISRREGQTADVVEILAFILRIMNSEDTSSSPDVASSFIIRFQQLTAAVMAQAIQKSYRYARGPIALDELMLSASPTSDPIGAFHRKMVDRAAAMPSGMLATSFSYTTKFGEDARMRLLAFSEASGVWARAVDAWRQCHAANLATIEAVVAPDPKTEWLIYQTLAAIWPVSLRIDDDAGLASVREELVGFMERAIRESEKQSFWTGVNKPYEQAVMNYVDGLFADKEFLSEFVETMRPFWLTGALNSFSQTVLKLTAPGIPVIHNGAETWDLSVSSAPTRGSFDFDALKDQLAYADQSPLNLLLEDWYSGGVKQRILKSHLKMRQEMPRLFSEGKYIPLKAVGKQANHIVAFYREFEEQYAVIAVPRLCFDMLKPFTTPFLPLPEWEGTFLQVPDALVGKQFRHVMTDKGFTLASKVSLVEVLREFPVMTLVSE